MRRDADIGEANLRRPLPVLGRIAAPAHARSVGVDKEEDDPVTIAALAAYARRDDELIGAVALADERFFSVQHESAAAVLDRAQGHIVEIEARLFLHMREAQPELARRDRADQLGALLVACAVLQQGAAQDDGLKVGLERQRLAELLHHDHGLDRAAAEAAVSFSKGRAEQAHLGVVAPQGFAPTVRACLIGLASLEPVPVLHQPRDIIAQKLLFGVELKVHVPQSPSIALAMMLRWISFDPP